MGMLLVLPWLGEPVTVVVAPPQPVMYLLSHMSTRKAGGDMLGKFALLLPNRVEKMMPVRSGSSLVTNWVAPVFS